MLGLKSAGRQGGRMDEEEVKESKDRLETVRMS